MFFVADVQTGFGPFVAVYLTSQKWTQVDIGLVLSIGGMVALLGQMPGGALVDAARSERLVAGVALTAIAASALAYALLPIFPVLLLAAAALHAAASCVLGPCIAAISLGLVGHAAIGERLGRNARFASIGNGVAAAAMGACRISASRRAAVFFVTAALLIPTLLALSRIRPREIDPELAHGGLVRRHARAHAGADPQHPAASAPLFILAGCVLAVPSRQRRDAAADGERADHAVERMGDGADRRLHRRAAARRRADLALGRAQRADLGPPAVPAAGVRARWRCAALLFALVDRSVSAGRRADPRRHHGRGARRHGAADGRRHHARHRPLQLAQGIVGTAVGIGASISPTLAGYLSDHSAASVAFFGLAAIAAVGFAGVWALMPETAAARPSRSS